ncbi:hypothetical protein ITX31_00335 [Arthrobacter gandavensis]|uniref:hypothetical protein n=1 Tax=Arthrobacter gandavensis TaxID=169960 RepID=UPI00188E6463|nr:hypothetical protein [Arthrobacter gandavensis]MBF4992560.1 hypothetical protein [Arthrobacter gandavensis]
MADNKDLPDDPHLREDISLPLHEPDDEAAHLAEDAGIPEGAAAGPEFDEHHYTAGQLNAGQYAAGLSPDGEYAQKREEELESE